MDNQTNLSQRFLTIVILWISIFLSATIFLIIVYVIPSQVQSDPAATPWLSLIGLLPVSASFLVKQQILNQAIAQQRLERVQVAYVAAFALCEMSALLGVLNHFAFGSRLYYLGFLFAGLGMLMHFPRKKHLLAASGQEF